MQSEFISFKLHLHVHSSSRELVLQVGTLVDKKVIKFSHVISANTVSSKLIGN